MSHRRENPESPFEPLPSGKGSLPSETVEQNQRTRIIAATARALSERGYADATVSDITGYAGVSRVTFYKFYANKQDCVLAAHQAVLERLLAILEGACDVESEWSARLRTALAKSLAFVAEAPEEAHLLILDGKTVVPPLAEQILNSRQRLAALLRPAREQLAPAVPPPPLTETALVSAMLAVVAERLTGAEFAPGTDLLSELHSLALIPYLGPEAAQRIAAAGDGAGGSR